MGGRTFCFNEPDIIKSSKQKGKQGTKTEEKRNGKKSRKKRKRKQNQKQKKKKHGNQTLDCISQPQAADS